MFNIIVITSYLKLVDQDMTRAGLAY